MTVASAPPTIWPSGIVPQTMNRIVAFILPCIRGGVIAWRRLTWLMFQATLQKPPMKVVAATAAKSAASGAAATGKADTLKPIAVRTSIRPTPSRAVSRLVVSAAARTPTEPIENAKPRLCGVKPWSRTR